MRCLFVINKIDTISLDEVDRSVLLVSLCVYEAAELRSTDVTIRLAHEDNTVVISCEWYELLWG